MIFVITHEKDAHGQHMVGLLRQLGESVRIIDYSQYPSRLEISFQADNNGDGLSFRFPDGEKIQANSVKSVLNRRQADPVPESGFKDSRIADYIIRELRNFLEALPQITDCVWISDPDAVRKAGRKPYQLRLAKRLGFLIPDTIIGNYPETAKRFMENSEDDIACKTLWTPGIAVKRSDEEIGIQLFTRRLTKKESLDNSSRVHNCPIIFQRYIQKAFELRITVVRDRVFACAIYSQESEMTQEDWRRYDLENTPHEIFQLPEEIERKCIDLVRTLGLFFGCIDMIVTPAGEYVFLEINPNGQWLWIEHLTGLPISQAIADLLVNPPVD